LSGIDPDFSSPCPGCGQVGFSVEVWFEGVKMMQCAIDDCRVHEYEPRKAQTEADR